MSPRLKAAIFVQALIRRAEGSGAQAYLLRRGSEEAGAVFLKINRLDGRVSVLSPASQGAARVWTKAVGDDGDEDKARAYLERQVKFDPDIWILEIEDRAGRAFVDEPII